MHRSSLKIGKRKLAKLYPSHTTGAIGKMIGASAENVRLRLHELGIRVMSSGKRRALVLPKEELEKLYKKHTMLEIAEMYGCGETVVWKRLHAYGIMRRYGEGGAHQLKPGHRLSDDHYKALVEAGKKRRGKWRGELNPRWRGGISQLNLRERTTGQYKEWRREAMKRAKYTCAGCGLNHGDVCSHCGHQASLHVHHIYSFAKFPERRFDPANSEVLCNACHRARHRSKLGEVGETPNVKSRAIPSEAAAG